MTKKNELDGHRDEPVQTCCTQVEAEGDPILRRRIDQVLRDLATAPYQPHLQLHHLHGALRDYRAVRIDDDIRIVLTLQVTEREIILHDIGSHTQGYR